MEKSLIRNIGITGITLVSLGLTKLVFNVSIGRVFGASTLGVVSLAMSAAFILVPVVGFFKGATTKYMAEYLGQGDVDSAKGMFKLGFYCTLCLGIMFTFIILTMSSWLSQTIGIEKDTFLSGVPLILLYAFYLHYRLLYYGINKVERYLKAEIISDIIFFVCLGAVVFYFESIFLLPFILSYLCFFMISTYFFKACFGHTSGDKKLIAKKALPYSSIALIGNIASIVVVELGVLLTGMYVSTIWVGYYAAACSIIIPLHFVPRAIEPVIYSSQSYHYGKNRVDLINETLNVFTNWLIIIMSLVVGIAILSSEFVLKLLFGAPYTVASTTLQLLVISTMLRIVATPIIYTFSGTRYIHISTIYGIIVVITSVGCWSILIPTYGIFGTALGLFFGAASSLIFGIFYAHKYFDLNLKANGKIILSSSLLLIIALMIQSFCPYYPMLISIGIFIILFVFVNKEDLQNMYSGFLSNLL